MNELFVKAFDFGIRVIELSNYLDEEERPFPLKTRLLECGTGILVNLRILDHFPKSKLQHGMLAFKLAVETEYLLELMVKTGFMNENQSKLILADCRFLKDETKILLNKKTG